MEHKHLRKLGIIYYSVYHFYYRFVNLKSPCHPRVQSKQCQSCKRRVFIPSCWTMSWNFTTFKLCMYLTLLLFWRMLYLLSLACTSLHDVCALPGNADYLLMLLRRNKEELFNLFTSPPWTSPMAQSNFCISIMDLFIQPKLSHYLR